MYRHSVELKVENFIISYSSNYNVFCIFPLRLGPLERNSCLAKRFRIVGRSKYGGITTRCSTSCSGEFFR